MVSIFKFAKSGHNHQGNGRETVGKVRNSDENVKIMDCRKGKSKDLKKMERKKNGKHVEGEEWKMEMDSLDCCLIVEWLNLCFFTSGQFSWVRNFNFLFYQTLFMKI